MDDKIEEKNSKRTGFLYILCALSIISNLLISLVLFVLLSGTKSMIVLESIPLIDVITDELKSGSTLFYLIKISIHLFCIFSVVLIAKKLKKGFAFYVLCQAILLILPWIFLLRLGWGYLLMNTAISLIFSLFFIMLFALYLPRKQKNSPTSS
jgi:hypothetical protein